MTREQLCELIQRRLAGGNVPDDFSPKIEEINYWVEHGIAFAAMKSYTDNANVADIEFVSDSFYTTFYNLPLQKNDLTNSWYTYIPSMPYGLPRGHDVVSASVQGQNGLNKNMWRLTISQAAYFKNMDVRKNEIFYWIEGNKINVSGEPLLDNQSIMVSMAGSSGSVDLTETVMCPPDSIPNVVDYIVRQFIQPVQKDLSNDGVQV